MREKMQKKNSFERGTTHLFLKIRCNVMNLFENNNQISIFNNYLNLPSNSPKIKELCLWYELQNMEFWSMKWHKVFWSFTILDLKAPTNSNTAWEFSNSFTYFACRYHILLLRLPTLTSNLQYYFKSTWFIFWFF